MEWYKVRFGIDKDNMQWNVQAYSKDDALEKFMKTEYGKSGQHKVFSISKL